MIEQIHRSTQHKGKVPSRLGDENQRLQAVETLQTQLQDAIRSEDYERAAVLRDEIKKLKEHGA